MWIPHLNISSSTAHKQGIPVFIGTFIFGAVTNKSDIPLWKLPREITLSLTILTYSMRFAEVIFFSLVFLMMAREVKEVITELFMDRDSEEEPDENDNDFDSSFVPETAPEE